MPRIGSEHKVILDDGFEMTVSGPPEGRDNRKPIKVGCSVILLVIGLLLVYGGIKGKVYTDNPVNKPEIESTRAADMAQINEGIKGLVVDFPAEVIGTKGWWVSLIFGLPVLIAVGWFLLYSFGDALGGVMHWFDDSDGND